MAEVPGPTNISTEVGPPQAPWLTMATTLLLLLFFGGLVYAVYYWSTQTELKPATLSGEQKLQELKANQSEITETYGYDKAANTWRVPVDVAVGQMIAEGETTGKLSLPMPKKK